MKGTKNFRDKTLREIKWWAWLAAVAPMSALAIIFFLWVFGYNTVIQELMVIGFATMFSIAVVWWWWALAKIAKVTDTLGRTINSFDSVKQELQEIKKDIKDLGAE